MKTAAKTKIKRHLNKPEGTLMSISIVQISWSPISTDEITNATLKSSMSIKPDTTVRRQQP